MRKSIPSVTKRKLIQESQSTCPFCGEDDVSTGQFHHITPVAEGGKNSLQNLIYLCANCHSKVTQGQISLDEVVRIKEVLTKGGHPYADNRVGSNVIHADFTKGTNKGVVANKIETVEIKTTRKSVKVSPPVGSIGSSLSHKNYVKHLIDRYHEFKKIEVGQGGMKYAVFYQQIKRRFGAKWDMIPLQSFDALVHFIQSRIDKTKHGRIRKAHGKKSYSEFEEYLNKY
ncbi:MAG: HNH endonuclease signature motif containing protein [Gemmatimonadetes bacterium]|nr:HNH endonuclease signature motif containing protein [Gemmatimonadota bacterium]